MPWKKFKTLLSRLKTKHSYTLLFKENPQFEAYYRQTYPISYYIINPIIEPLFKSIGRIVGKCKGVNVLPKRHN